MLGTDEGWAAELDQHTGSLGTGNDTRAASLNDEHGTLQGQLRRLKPWTYFALVALALLVFLFGLWHWQLMLVVLALLAPTLGKLLHWWQKDPTRCPLDHVLASYLFGLFPLAIAAMSTACAACFLAIWIFRLVFAIFHIFAIPYIGDLLFWICVWGVFSFVEDLWHIAHLRASKRRRAHHHSGKKEQQRASVAYACASSVGYATAQCVALTCIVTAIMEGHTLFELHGEHARGGEITANEGGWLFVLTLVFTWYWLPLRLLTNHLLALELAREPDHGAEEDRGCDAVCPLAEGLSGPRERLKAFWRVAGWPWSLRTAHATAFIFWFSVFIDINFFLWLAAAFLSWGAVCYAAWKRILWVEDQLDPAARATGLRELYGFSLLADAGGDVPLEMPAELPPEAPTSEIV